MANTTKNDEPVVTTAHPFEGLPRGEERLAKARLAQRINAQIQERGLKQKDAALLLGVTQPEVSQVSNGRLSGFTFDRLYRCLQALDMDIEITVKKHTLTDNSAAGIRVSHIYRI
ncbi:MAG: helix-turn-helix domain-containing protein [Methylococcales bacterium]